MTAQTGWIDPDQRTAEQTQIAEEFDRNTPAFGDVNQPLGDLPKHALLYEVEMKANGGKLCNRIWQMEGSCVGAAGGRSYTQAMCGDIVHRKTSEEVKDLCPWPTWGVGRRFAGMNRRGAGSFGAAQAKAVEQWGMLAADHQGLPEPANRDGWLVWSAKIELDYSYPRQWPIPESELAPAAAERKMGHVARITSMDDLKQAFAQGYGVTCASMYGTRPTVKGGFLIGEWNTSWAHQMSWSGYYTHDSLGVLVACDNQWGPAAHPACPFLSKMGVRGSFWIPEATVERLLKDRGAEVFAHGNTDDWPTRELDWDAMAMG